MLLQALIFGSIGLSLEVLFTAACDFATTRDRRLRGYSYIWMFPIYAAIPFCFRALEPFVGDYPFAARIAVYTTAVLAAEWLAGWALRLTVGEAPWEREYRGKRWAVQGLMRLDFAPAWAFATAYFEFIYTKLAFLT